MRQREPHRAHGVGLENISADQALAGERRKIELLAVDGRHARDVAQVAVDPLELGQTFRITLEIDEMDTHGR